ncbi:MAG TPA: hypothetical protein VLI04_14885 [Nocardioidaceae bacterium]|nr:hypothetical protein [Nocardioidaceae bacterium]
MSGLRRTVPADHQQVNPAAERIARFHKGRREFKDLDREVYDAWVISTLLIHVDDATADAAMAGAKRKAKEGWRP